MLKEVILLLVMATSIPAGMLLAYLCKEELRELKKWFYVLIVSSLIGISALVLFYRRLEIILALVYVMIAGFMCLRGRK